MRQVVRPWCEFVRPLAIATAVGLLAAAAGGQSASSAAPPATPAPEPAPALANGPAARAGAAIDRACEDLLAWASSVRATSGAKAATAAESIESAARRWLKDADLQLFGDPDAPATRAVRMVRRLTLPTPAAEAEARSAQTPICYDWVDVEPLVLRAQPLPEHAVVLLHGLDEPGTGWDDLTPHLIKAGYQIIAIDYANDAPLAAEADFVGRSLKDLRAAGVRRIDIVAHSMGGIVARDLLTRPEWYAGDGRGRADLPDVRRFILMAAPNAGAILAHLQPISEAREHLSRSIDDLKSHGDGLLASHADGAGQAGSDLLPGSPYLTDLNARPLPKNVAITNIVAALIPESRIEDLASRADAVGADIARDTGLSVGTDLRPALRALSARVGDGLVSLESARLPGVEDTVIVHADHRSLVRLWTMLPRPKHLTFSTPDETPAIPIILERLARPDAP